VTCWLPVDAGFFGLRRCCLYASSIHALALARDLSSSPSGTRRPITGVLVIVLFHLLVTLEEGLTMGIVAYEGSTRVDRPSRKEIGGFNNSLVAGARGCSLFTGYSFTV